MSRRRNRINANLLTADELEEKTKTEVTPAAAEQDGAEASSSVRVTRNLRKRQKND